MRQSSRVADVIFARGFGVDGVLLCLCVKFVELRDLKSDERQDQTVVFGSQNLITN